MATVKAVILKHQHKEDGTWNVKIRISQKGGSAYIPTPYFVPESLVRKDYTLKEKNNPIFDAVTKEVLKIRSELVRLGRSVDLYTAKELSEHMKVLLEGKTEEVDFIAEGMALVERMRVDGRDRAHIYKAMLNRFREYVGKDTFPINDITSGFVRRFEDYLFNYTSKHTKRKLTSGGVSQYMSMMSKVISEAKKRYNDDDKGQIVVTCNPFSNYSLPKKNPVKHRALSVEQIRQVIGCAIPPGETHMEMARDMFTISFMLCGMNTVDMYKCAAPRNGRVEFNRSKTCKKKADGAFMSIGIQPELVPYLERHKDYVGEHLLSVHRFYTTFNGFNFSVNRHLKKVGRMCGIENLTTYAARHSFATIARNDCGFPMEDIAMCLAHSCPFRMTDTYVRTDWSRVDKVVRAVLDLILGTKK